MDKNIRKLNKIYDIVTVIMKVLERQFLYVYKRKTLLNGFRDKYQTEQKKTFDKENHNNKLFYTQVVMMLLTMTTSRNRPHPLIQIQ